MANSEVTASAKTDEPAGEPLEGGLVPPLEDLQILQRHRADTARHLAYGLAALLAVAVVLHYVLTTWMAYAGKTEAVASLEKTFTIVLPVLASLVSSAATYYFTREKQ